MVTGPTILDVLDNRLGERPTREQLQLLSVRELEDVSGYLAELAAAQADEVVEDGASLLGGWLTSLWSEQMLRDELSDCLLYYPRLLVLDPLANFFDDRSALPPPHPVRYTRSDGRDNIVSSGAALWSRAGTFEEARVDPHEAAKRFAAIVSNLYELAPLIREGVVVFEVNGRLFLGGRPSSRLPSVMTSDRASCRPTFVMFRLMGWGRRFGTRCAG